MKAEPGVQNKRGLEDRVAWFGGVLAAVFVLGMALLIFTGITARYFNHPLMFSDEYACYLMVGATYCGIIWSYHTGRLVGVDFIFKRFPPVVQSYLGLLWEVICFIYGVILTYEAVRAIKFSFTYNARAVTMTRTPLWIPEILMVVGLVLLCVFMLLVIIRDTKSKLKRAGK